MLKASLQAERRSVLSAVDPRIYGSFIEHLGRAVYEGIYQPGSPFADENGFRTDVIKLINELNVPIVRYPGGNFVSGYKWEDGIGPKENRPRRADLAWNTIETNQFGLHEFMKWTEAAHTSPMMAVNLGTRGVQEAKDLLEYTAIPGGTKLSDWRRANGQEKPFDIPLWCLGNEMDGPWQMGHKTAAEYGRLAAEAGRVMKMTAPGIELVACGSSNYYMPTFGCWEDTVLDLAYDQVDYISLHEYFSNAADNTPEFLAESVGFDQFISAVIAICDGVRARKKKSRKINLSFDEWNVWYHSKDQDKEIPHWITAPHLLEDVYNFEDALLVASLMITLLRHADRVKVACLAQLVNVIAPIMTSDTGAWRQTIFHPFAMISNHGRGEVLHTEVVSDAYECRHGDAKYLDAVVVKDEENETFTVFAVNKSLTDSMELTADFRPFAGYRLAEHQVLRHEDLKAVNTEAEPENVKPVAGSGAVFEDGKLTAVLPDKSFTMLVFKK